MTPRIAIVGAGPAGLYLLGALARCSEAVQIDVFERLSVPYGLLRHGVASDHQGTKAVARQLARPFDKGQARFFGRTELGHNICLEELRARYHAVVLATGAPRDRKLDISGSDRAPVYSANQILRHLNDDPRAEILPDLGDAPVIIGAGYVALDLIRLLLKDASGLIGSDLSPKATDWLLSASRRKVTLVARCAADDARFDVPMIRELAALPNCEISIDPIPVGSDPKSEAFRSIICGGSTRLELKFCRQPRSIRIKNLGQVYLEVGAPDGVESIPATSIITAIGTEANPDAPLPGVYRLGWCSGASGALPDARSAALKLCDKMLQTLPELPSPREDALADPTWGWAAWRALNAEKLAVAPADRVRQKIVNEDMQDRIAVRAKQEKEHS